MDHVTKAAASILQISAEELSVALERARVVGVLDAWAALAPTKRAHETNAYTCVLKLGNKSQLFHAGTPDAARAAAAKAIEAGEV